MVTDAETAEYAISHDAEVHAADHDFRCFPGLNCRFLLGA